MMMNYTLKIEGMHCSKCVERVNGALCELQGAKDVKVDLGRGCATLETDATVEQIKEAVEDLGFEVAEIK